MDKEKKMKRIALLLAAMVIPVGAAFAGVDVNTATKEELEAEGIGAVGAQAIIDYRTKNGPFKSPEDVRKVISDAIGAKMNIGISISGPGSTKPAPAAGTASTAPPAAPATTTSAQVTPKPEVKAPVAAVDSKPQEKSGSKDENPDNVRERAKRDQDDRKT